MLVSFSVSNFKSIADEQQLSLVRNKNLRKDADRFSLKTANSLAPELVSVCCILGPNGSGKTTLIEAMMFLSDFVKNSARTGQVGDKIFVPQYRLSEEFAGEPTTFEVTFIFGEDLFQYGISLTEERVVGEWLFVKPNSAKTRSRRVFQREYDEESDEYHWYINESVVKGQRNTWRDATRENASFLSVAVQLNSESLKKPFDWIVYFWRMIPGAGRLGTDFSAQKVLEDAQYKSRILNFMRSSGLKMNDVISEKDEEFITKFQNAEYLKDFITEKGRKTILDSIKNGRDLADFKVRFSHSSEEGKNVLLDFEEESDGTRALFAIAGPIVDTLENGFTLVIDELNTALHTVVMDYIIKIFSDSDRNRNGAQLIFTTHDTNVLVANEINTDQVYFADMDKGSRTRLVPLMDFKIRAKTNPEKNYLSGRYGAIPEIMD